MNNDIQNLVNELNSTTPKTQMYMIQLCRSAINNLYDLTDTIEENISSLQNSVVANTSAISGLQGSIDVINTNLSAYLGRIEVLEDKTTYISKTENNSTRIANSLIVENDIDADGLYITGDITAEGEIIGKVLESNNDNGRGRFYIDGDGDMALSLPPNAGKLITTGNIEQYASNTKTYLHKISFTAYLGTNNQRIIARFDFTSSDNTPLTTETAIIEKFIMSGTGTTYGDVIKPIGGLIIDNSLAMPNAIVGNILLLMYKNTSTTIGICEPDGTKHINVGNIKDTIVEL